MRNMATLVLVAAGGWKEERTADHAAGAAEQPSACGVVGHSCPSSNADRPTESAHSVDRTGSDRVVSAVRPNGVLRVLHCCAALPVGNIAPRPAFGVAYTVQDRTNRLLLNAPIFPAMSVQRKALLTPQRSTPQHYCRSMSAAYCQIIRTTVGYSTVGLMQTGISRGSLRHDEQRIVRHANSCIQHTAFA